MLLLLARLMGQYSFARCRLSTSSVVCNARRRSVSAAAGPGAWPVRRPTLHGGTVRLRPGRATPCFCCMLPVVEIHIWHGGDVAIPMSRTRLLHNARQLGSKTLLQQIPPVFTARCYGSAVYAVVMCPSVTRRYCTKMAKRRIT